MSRKQKYFLILSVLTIISTYPQVSQADTYAVGSYQKSCNKIAVKDDKLSARCRTLKGEWKNTALNGLGACLNSISQNGDIGNIDGNLICLPDLPKVDPGFTFPKPETTINSWIYGNDLSSIYKHGWGIWAGLTSNVGNVDGTSVRAFETWNTPSNMLFQIESMPKAKAMPLPFPGKLKLDLMPPKRFNKKRFKSKKSVDTKSIPDGDTNIAVSVAFNPPAARHVITNKLLLQSTLNNYLKEGYTEIPNYPENAIVIKPVYKVISQSVPKGVYTFPGWPGTPSPAVTFPEGKWGSCVYVDIKGTGAGGNSIDKGCKGQTKDNIFYLNNFIHQKINKEDANFLSTQLSVSVKPGDFAILVGMHVTTREIKRWVWQSFWWSANPDKPYLPSSFKIAGVRPTKSLDKAAQHYAMTVAYQMVSPAQPITGGKSIGSSVIGYNPHLEAEFDPATFQILRPINGKIVNKYGVQTNCMTCHNQALYNPKKNYKTASREDPYGTDYYMSIIDKEFDKKLKLDFSGYPG